MTTGVIIDVALVAVFLIALIVGLVKGFNKLFMGFLSTIGGLAIAAALCVVVANKLIEIPQIQQLAQVFAGWFNRPNLQMEISSLEELTTLLSSGLLALLSGRADAIWQKMQGYQVNTLAGYYGHVVLKVFASVLCFIVLIIVVRLILNGICKLLQKLNKFTVFKVINMVLGAAWAVGITYLVVVSVVLTGAELVLAKWFSDLIPVVQSEVADSAVLRLLHSTNIIGQYAAQAFSLPLPDLFPPAG